MHGQEQGAEQVAFSVDESRGRWHFEYIWTGVNGEEQAVFSIPTNIIQQGATEFRGAAACMSAAFDVMTAEKAGVERAFGVSLSFAKAKDGWTSSMSGERDQLLRAEAYLAARRKEIESVVYPKNFCMLSSRGEMCPDYLGIAKRYAAPMKPVAFALHRSSESKRKFVERCLTFLQAIPFAEVFSNGLGFQTPVGMLAENRGDCDTKAAALAAMLYNYGIATIFVTVEKHMLVGVRIPAAAGDSIVKFNGSSYVLAEPVGPAMVPLGKISRESQTGLHDAGVIGPTIY